MSIRCSYDTCPTAAMLRGYCEQHFLMQYVQPLQKERRNIEDTLAILNGSIKAFVDELGIARSIARGIVNPERFLRQSPAGNGWTNTGTVFCHKCYKPFDSGIDCIQHEEDCRGKPKSSGAKRRASSTSTNTTKTPRSIKATIIDNEPIDSEI